MMGEGLLEEVRGLLEAGHDPSLACFRSPGYREMIAHLRGDLSLEDAILRAKRETRRFAKRQITWYRKEEVWWVDPSEAGGADRAARRIEGWYLASIS
jgi:tRNA dimethylallyltransferase